MINYLTGDATEPTGEGKKFILHICNDEGKWGAGFVMALSKKWPEPERVYRTTLHYLTEVQFVPVSKDIIVVNMVAQSGVKKKTPDECLVDYAALEICLDIVNEFIRENIPDATVHMPRIGCGLAGGEWEDIEKSITDNLVDVGEIYVYDWEE